MKTYKKAAVGKLLIRFDNELKNILTKDLNSFMVKNPFLISNKQAIIQQELSVA
ncbi:MAG TPA: hypothetical protein VIJ27_01350 [Mucilaginibacter sp.]|jgi:hypothetical protein